MGLLSRASQTWHSGRRCRLFRTSTRVHGIALRRPPRTLPVAGRVSEWIQLPQSPLVTVLSAGPAAGPVGEGRAGSDTGRRSPASAHPPGTPHTQGALLGLPGWPSPRGSLGSARLQIPTVLAAPPTLSCLTGLRNPKHRFQRASPARGRTIGSGHGCVTAGEMTCVHHRCVLSAGREPKTLRDGAGTPTLDAS